MEYISIRDRKSESDLVGPFHTHFILMCNLDVWLDDTPSWGHQAIVCKNSNWIDGEKLLSVTFLMLLQLYLKIIWMVL